MPLKTCRTPPHHCFPGISDGSSAPMGTPFLFHELNKIPHEGTAMTGPHHPVTGGSDRRLALCLAHPPRAGRHRSRHDGDGCPAAERQHSV